MKKGVYEYFMDLDKSGLKKKNGNFIVDGVRIEMFNPNMVFKMAPSLSVDGVEYFAKRHKCARTIGDIASAKMYGEIGFVTPPLYTLKEKEGRGKEDCFVISQNIRSIGGYDFIVEEDLMLSEIGVFPTVSGNDFAPLYDESVRDRLLEFMTEECLDERMGLGLNDTIRTEIDRHGENVYYYKKSGAKRYEGIVPIDHEFMRILYDGVNNRDELKTILNSPYMSYTFIGSSRETSYADRVEEVLSLINSGKIKEKQILQLKNALEFDLPKTMKEVAKNPFLKPYADRPIEQAERLWEYNRNTIGKELGL